MRVLFLQAQPCVRTLKYAAALRERHPEVRLAFAHQGRTLSGFYGEGDELFECWFDLPLVAPGPRLAAAIELWRPDLIHHHNLPDRLATVALDEVGGAIPLVHDVHDMWSLRRTAYEDGLSEGPVDGAGDERRAIEGADAVVAVSEQMAREILARYDARRMVVYPNYARRVGPPPLQGVDGGRVVYQGTLTTNDGHYDLRRIFTELGASGLALDIHTRRAAGAYRRLGPRVRLQPPLTPSGVMHVLGRYGWGWAGFNARLNGRHLDTALPNKVFEYVACGLPFLCLPHKALAELARDWGVGVVVASPEEARDALASVDRDALAAAAVKRRVEATVGAHVHRIVDLYRQLMVGSR